MFIDCIGCVAVCLFVGYFACGLFRCSIVGFIWVALVFCVIGVVWIYIVGLVYFCF